MMTLNEPNPWSGSPSNGLCSLPGTRDAPRAARRVITHTLGPACPLLEDAVLVGSELVTNAVRHSRSKLPAGLVGLTIEEPQQGVVHIEVIDNGPLPHRPSQPALHAPDTLREFGLGLPLVDSIAHDWGVIHHASGYCTVWALLAYGNGHAA